MKTKVKYISDTKVELTVSVEPKELEAAEQVALKRMARDLKVAGFRKGKVPLSVAQKHINPAALSEQTLENAISKAVAEAFISENIQALDRPQVEVKKFVPGQELEFTAESEIIPKVKLGDYKKLKSRPGKVSVEAKDIDDIIERMQDSFAEKSEVKREAKSGDIANIDFVGKKDDVAFDGGAAKGYELKLGANQFIPGFEEGVIGHKAGDKFELKLKFPKDYHAKDLAGKPVVFEVTLNSVSEVTPPELDDEFAAKCGPFTSMEDLREDIGREIEIQKKRESDEAHKEALVNELSEKSDVPLPELLVEDQARSIEQDFTQNLTYRNLTIDSYLTSQGYKDKEDWHKKEVRPTAEKRVKAGLILAELSKELGVDVSREEVDSYISELKQSYGKDLSVANQFNDPEVHRDIANRLITEKTIEALKKVNDK